jgi:hypothetical protein
MKKYCILFLILMFTCGVVLGQNFKVARNSGKLVIHLPSVTVEGYDGLEIVLASDNKNIRKPPVDEKAKGLESVDGTSAHDNTGLGIGVTEKGDIVQVDQVSATDNKIKILVPKGVRISYISNNTDTSVKSVFRNLDSEIEINVQGNNIELSNVTGPMTVSSLYGNIDVTCKNPVKGPLSIVSISGYVDIALPLSTKTSLDMRSAYGQILIAPEFKMVVEMANIPDKLVGFNTRGVKGKINGGGMNIFLRSDHRKVYLRKL